jgi:glycosyltransferase involved in cell wall biosynthesis
MKIAIFVSYLPPHVGGIEVVAENQIKALAAKHQEVTVITSACGSKLGLEKYDYYEVRRIAAWNYFEEKMGAVFPLFSPSLMWHSYKAVKNADIVHAHDAFYLTSLSAAFWARVLRKPLIITQHVDMIPHPSPVVNLAQKLVYSTTGRFILHSSSKIIVLNSRVKSFLINKGINESNIRFLPNGLDTAAFSPTTVKQKRLLRKKYNLPQDKILALYVGRFVPKKGFTKLLRIKPIQNLDLVFAGGNRPTGHTRNDHHFLGAVGRPSIPDVFRMCDIFILPSEGEGFPVTVQEAMASGLLIATTDDPAYEPYALHRAHIELIEPTSAGIYHALTRLIARFNERDKTSTYVRNYAIEHFGLEANADKLIDIYEHVLSVKSTAVRLHKETV